MVSRVSQRCRAMSRGCRRDVAPCRERVGPCRGRVAGVSRHVASVSRHVAGVSRHVVSVSRACRAVSRRVTGCRSHVGDRSTCVNTSTCLKGPARLGGNFLPVQTYRHLVLSCFSAALKIAAHAERGSSYELDLSRSGSNECENVFSGLGGFGKILSNVRNYTFLQALERLGDLTTLELYKYLGSEDPLRFGSRMHKADVDIALHEEADEDANLSEHPENWRTVYEAAWTSGDEESQAVCDQLGMKPSGPTPSWWQRPWEDEEVDMKEMRTACADELGDEVVTDGLDDAGNVTGEQSTIEPDASIPGVAAHTADGVIAAATGTVGDDGEATSSGAGDAEAVEGGAEDSTVEEGVEDEGGVDDVNEPLAPQLFSTPARHAPGEDADSAAQPSLLNVDPDSAIDELTAAHLAAAFEHAQDTADSEQVAGDSSSKKAAASPPSSTNTTPTVGRSRKVAGATLSLPADEGGGFAHKRTIIAELSKLLPGQLRLSPDRLIRVRQAQRIMSESQREATGAGAKRPTAEAAVAEGEGDAGSSSSTSADGPTADDSKLRVGSDIGMAFRERDGRANRWVYWLACVQQIYRRRGKSGKVEVKRPVDVDELVDGGFLAVVSWYSRTRQRGIFKFNVVSDARPFSLDHFLGLVRLEFDPETDRYQLVDKEKQLAALAEATRRTEPKQKSSAEEQQAEARRRERQTAAHLQQQPEGAEERQKREQRLAERTRARGQSAAAAGAPPMHGTSEYMEYMLASSRFNAEPEDRQAEPQSQPELQPQAELEPQAAVEIEVTAATEAAPVEAADQDVQPSEPAPIACPPPSDGLLDPERDLSGDALTTTEALGRQRKGLVAWAQCSLSAVRNLLRGASVPASFLAQRQVGMSTGERDVADQGVEGDIRFPEWSSILRDLLREGEVVVRFNPQKVGASELLHDARLMAMVFLASTHVIAVHRDAASLRGRVTFRKYDNDSDARRRGTFERVSARQLWAGGVEMIAITTRNSALHRAAGDLRPIGTLREQRAAQLRVVLEGANLGLLLLTLEKAGIRTLKKFNEHTIVSLEVALQRAAGRPFALTVAQRRQLAVLGLREPSLEVQEMERS